MSDTQEPQATRKQQPPPMAHAEGATVNEDSTNDLAAELKEQPYQTSTSATEQASKETATIELAKERESSPAESTAVNTTEPQTTDGKAEHPREGGKGPDYYADIRNREEDEHDENDISSSESDSSQGSSSEEEGGKDGEETEGRKEEGESPSGEAGSSGPQHEEPLTPRCETDDESSDSDQATEEGPKPIQNLTVATVKEMKEHLAFAGLDTTGIRDVLLVRLLLHQHGLDEGEYSYRCSNLMNPKESKPPALKTRLLETFGIRSKSKSKTELVAELLLAERDNGISPDEADAEPKEEVIPATGDSATPAPKKTVAPKPGQTKKKPTSKPTEPQQGSKRKHADSTAGSDSGVAPAKRRKSQEAAPSEVTAVKDDGSGPTPQPAPTRPKKQLKRKRTEDDTASSGKETKRARNQGTLSAIDSDDTAATSPAANAPKEKSPKRQVDMTQSFKGQFMFGEKLNSSVFFENLPVPIGIANSAFRVLSGCALEDDATDVYLHRINLPKYKAYCEREVTDRTDDDKVWLAAEKYWEVFEMEAVRASIGDEFVPDSNFLEKTDGVDVRDYHRYRKLPEVGDEASRKNQQQLRDLETLLEKQRLIQIGSPMFKHLRLHGTW